MLGKKELTHAKTSKQMERHLKGIANHYRIDVLLFLLHRKRATLEEIVEGLEGNRSTIGEHVRRLYLAGLVNKQYRSHYMDHTLSPYGKEVVRFLQHFRNL